MNRGVRQLSHLFVNFSPNNTSSTVVEEFISSGMLKQFRLRHPGVVVEAVSSRKTKPFVQAAYRNKHGSTLSLVDCRTPEAVQSVCQRLADQIGRAPGQQGALKRKPFIQSGTTSLQGRWNPTFELKTFEEQIAPLQKKQTHILGLAPPIDAKPQA